MKNVSNEMESISIKDFIEENTHSPPKIWKFVEVTENGYD